MTESLDAADRRRFAGSYAHREKAPLHLAFGVSSTRARRSGLWPSRSSARGRYVVDVDGNRFIDYSLGYGPLILGHNPLPSSRPSGTNSTAGCVPRASIAARRNWPS